MDEWRPLHGFEEYFEMSRAGQIRSTVRKGIRVPKLIKPRANGFVMLTVCGKTIGRKLWRLHVQTWPEEAANIAVPVKGWAFDPSERYEDKRKRKSRHQRIYRRPVKDAAWGRTKRPVVVSIVCEATGNIHVEPKIPRTIEANATLVISAKARGRAAKPQTTKPRTTTPKPVTVKAPIKRKQSKPSPEPFYRPSVSELLLKDRIAGPVDMSADKIARLRVLREARDRGDK